MSRVITFSIVYPSYHPNAGQPTGFIEKIWKSLDPNYMEYDRNTGTGDPSGIIPKYHTIRAGHRWRVGDKFSPRVWSARPYRSKQITIAPDMEVKKVWDFCIDPLGGEYRMNGVQITYEKLKLIAKNDGFDHVDDFELWFKLNKREGFIGQIICWNEKIEY